MYLKEIDTIWGTTVSSLKDYAKKYKIAQSIMWGGDIFLVLILSWILATLNAPVSVWFLSLSIVCLLFYALLLTFINPNKYNTFKFFKRNRNHLLVEKKYNIDEKKLFSVLYCTVHSKRVKTNKDMDYYMNLALNYCAEDCSFSCKFMKYLSKYEDIDGSVSVYVLEKGRKSYFIDFVSSDEASLEED